MRPAAWAVPTPVPARGRWPRKCKSLGTRALGDENPGPGKDDDTAAAPHRGIPAARRELRRLTSTTRGGIVEGPGEEPGPTMNGLPDVPRRTGASLRVRLLLMGALSAAVVVGGTTWLQRRIIVSAVEEEA